MRGIYMGVAVAAVLAVALIGCQDRAEVRPFTVSELLAARDAGRLGSSPATLSGFWSGPGMVHGCAPRVDQPGELEMYCQDGDFGITELNEPIVGAVGPHLTPWLPDALWQRLEGQPRPPMRVVVVGHFDDPRAAKCRPEAVQLCRERFVVDDIL